MVFLTDIYRHIYTQLPPHPPTPPQLKWLYSVENSSTNQSSASVCTLIRSPVEAPPLVSKSKHRKIWKRRKHHHHNHHHHHAESTVSKELRLRVKHRPKKHKQQNMEKKYQQQKKKYQLDPVLVRFYGWTSISLSAWSSPSISPGRFWRFWWSSKIHIDSDSSGLSQTDQLNQLDAAAGFTSCWRNSSFYLPIMHWDALGCPLAAERRHSGDK